MAGKVRVVAQDPFVDWINSIGVARLAKLLKVAEPTVRHWRRGHCIPRPPEMEAIKKLSRGAVPYGAMVETYFRIKATKKSSK